MAIVCSNCAVAPAAGALAGGACASCGGPLIADPYASLEGASAIALDELAPTGSKPRAKSEPMFPAQPTEQETLGQIDERFTAPESGPPPKLEIDRAYLNERSMKLAQRQAQATTVKRKSVVGKLVAFLLIAGLLGTGGYLAYRYKLDRDRKAQSK